MSAKKAARKALHRRGLGRLASLAASSMARYLVAQTPSRADIVFVARRRPNSQSTLALHLFSAAWHALPVPEASHVKESATLFVGIARNAWRRTGKGLCFLVVVYSSGISVNVCGVQGVCVGALLQSCVWCGLKCLVRSNGGLLERSSPRCAM